MSKKKVNTLKVQRIDEQAQLPTKAHNSSTEAGWDCYVHSVERNYDTIPGRDDVSYVKFIEYGLGIKVKIPDGFFGILVPRSSMTKIDMMIKNGIGIIDNTYRGELKMRLTPMISEKGEEYVIGDRCCQLVLIEQPNFKLKEVKKLDTDTVRGEGGFGSSDKELDKGNNIDKKV